MMFCNHFGVKGLGLGTTFVCLFHEFWSFHVCATLGHLRLLCVMCHVSKYFVKHCYIVFLFVFHPKQKFVQSCGAGRWRVCYQRGLPCLVTAMTTMTDDRRRTLLVVDFLWHQLTHFSLLKEKHWLPPCLSAPCPELEPDGACSFTTVPA